MSWGCPENMVEQMGVTLLTPLTWPYRLMLNLHKHAHKVARKENLLPGGKLSKPVISIGNLTVGGTGKTPIIVDLTAKLLAHNIKVGILSRGYKRANSSACIIVSDGKGNFASLEEAGDEPLMMAKMLPQAVVIVNKDRYLAGRIAIRGYDCEVLLLDDGFQHWRLERDCDIVLLDYECPPWSDSLLPVGRLREPLSALKRAQHVIITKIPHSYDQEKIDRFREIIGHYAPQCTISMCRFEPSSVQQQIAGKWTEVSLDKLKGLPVVAFCGIAQPQGFMDMLLQLGVKVKEAINYGDHHRYSERDIAGLEDLRNSKKAEYLITTRKDLIKIENSPDSARVLALNISTSWIGEPLDILSLIKSAPMPMTSYESIVGP